MSGGMKRACAINPIKISEALGVPWEHPHEEDCDTGRVKLLSNLFVWPLRERHDRQSLMTLRYSLVNPERIDLDIECGGYQSTIVFDGIQKFKCVPQYHYIEFMRWRGQYPDKLKVWWRGQFDLYIH